jgi:predicted HicB family RNase H-like nuclease
MACNMHYDEPMNKTRNFALHISADQKERLKRLAAESNMTLTQYIEEVLNEAVSGQNLFEVVTRRVPAAEKRKVASAAH